MTFERAKIKDPCEFNAWTDEYYKNMRFHPSLACAWAEKGERQQKKIDKLEAENKRLREALKGVCDHWYQSGKVMVPKHVEVCMKTLSEIGGKDE